MNNMRRILSESIDAPLAPYAAQISQKDVARHAIMFALGTVYDLRDAINGNEERDGERLPLSLIAARDKLEGLRDYIGSLPAQLERNVRSTVSKHVAAAFRKHGYSADDVDGFEGFNHYVMPVAGGVA